MKSSDDLVTALTERLRGLRSSFGGEFFTEEQVKVAAREALAFVAERLPTREKIRGVVRDCSLSGKLGTVVVYPTQVTDALLALLRERLGVKG